MKVGIMQPYFMPYIGYFQLIAAVDTFIVYDNIKYTKKGWINRNRMLCNGSDVMFTLPLKNDSDSLDIVDRELATGFDRIKLLNQMRGAYQHAPCFEQTYPLIEEVVRYEDSNLFRFIQNSIVKTCGHLGIGTDLRVSSSVDVSHHSLKGQDRVLAMCKAVGAAGYINSIGGVDLYSREEFYAAGVDLKFIKPGKIEYKQYSNNFIPSLSIVDVLMFNPLAKVKKWVKFDYDLD